MKKLITIIAICLFINASAQSVLIGEGAGKSITSEKYCVIVGHDSTHINAQGNDMLWIVDFREPALTDAVRSLLKNYKDAIGTRWDTIEKRRELIARISLVLLREQGW